MRNRTSSMPSSSHTNILPFNRTKNLLSARSYQLRSGTTSPAGAAHSPTIPLTSRTYCSVSSRSSTPFPTGSQKIDIVPVKPTWDDQISVPSSRSSGSQAGHLAPNSGIKEVVSHTSIAAQRNSVLPKADVSETLLELPGDTYGVLTPLSVTPILPPASYLRAELDSSFSLQNRGGPSTSLPRKFTDQPDTPRPRYAGTFGSNSRHPSTISSPIPQISFKFRSPSNSSGDRAKTPAITLHDSGSSNAYTLGPNHRSSSQSITQRLPRPVDLTPEGNFHRETIDFRVKGTLGIRIKDLLDYKAVVDDGETPMFVNHSWRKTGLAIHVRTCIQ